MTTAINEEDQGKAAKALRKLASILGWIVIWAVIVGLALSLIGVGLWLFSLLDWARIVSTQDPKIILGFVQALAWPVLSLIVLIVFKKNISALIDRTKKLNAPGVSAEFSTQSPPPAEAQTEIADVNETVPAPVGPDAVEEAAFNNAEIQVIFWRIYQNIFGTQFLALNFLAANPTSLNSSLLSHLYERHLALVRPPIPYTTIQAWMNYLVTSGLVEYVEAADTYRILPAGALFLRYMASQGLSADGKGL